MMSSLTESKPPHQGAGLVSVTEDMATVDVLERTNKCQTSEEVIRQYEKSATRYEDDMRYVEYVGHLMAAHAVEKLLTNTNRFDMKILDVGAGTGLLAMELAKQGYTNIDAVDGSNAMLKIAEERQLYKKIICHFVGDEPLPLEDDSYDMVVMSGSIGPNFIPFSGLDEAVRLVRPGGYVVNAVSTWPWRAGWQAEFESYMQKLDRENKWRQVSKSPTQDFARRMHSDGHVYVHTVL